MKLKQLFTDEDAVSPVIGVILMVAITVILAAVIGTFVLGIGQDQQTTPSASFDFDEGPTSVTIIHDGGDTFSEDNTGSLQYGKQGASSLNDWSLSVAAGDTKTISASAGETIIVKWTAPGGGKTQILAEYEVQG